MIESLILDIHKHFEDNYPREGCGIVAVQKGKSKWFPCTNIAEDNEDFVIDSKEYLKIHRTSDIIGIVHSHPDATCEASESDIAHCNTLGVPYYIFSYPNMELNILTPKKNFTELYGRQYEFGVQDCFEAARDYLEKTGIYIKSRILFEDNWWKKDLNYFCDEMMQEWGFKKIDTEELTKNDIVTFSIRSDVPNHCGVFLGNDIFYHHAENRLSCRENLYPFWVTYLDRAYRYDA